MTVDDTRDGSAGCGGLLYVLRATFLQRPGWAPAPDENPDP